MYNFVGAYLWLAQQSGRMIWRHCKRFIVNRLKNLHLIIINMSIWGTCVAIHGILNRRQITCTSHQDLNVELFPGNSMCSKKILLSRKPGKMHFILDWNNESLMFFFHTYFNEMFLFYFDRLWASYYKQIRRKKWIKINRESAMKMVKWKWYCQLFSTEKENTKYTFSCWTHCRRQRRWRFYHE